jgi:P-type E1-E2 ATPase
VKYDKLSSEGKTVIFVGIEGKVVGLLVIVDEIKDRVREMVKELRRKNINIKMVTGDNFYAAKYISIKSGIDDFISDATPLKKAEIIREIKSDGYKVIMVGDGINDAPSLIEAHIGITFGKATDISLKSANVVIMRDNLRLIIDLFNISKNTLSIIKENICWALSYNFIVIPFAVSGFLHPIISAISMTISSIVVLCNSLRLRNKEWV